MGASTVDARARAQGYRFVNMQDPSIDAKNDKIIRKKRVKTLQKTNVFQALRSQNPVNTSSFCFPEVQKRAKTMLFTQFSALGDQKTP